MILFFSDLHLGLKHCSKQEHNGLFTSELEAFKALDYIYDYAKNPENNIDLIVCINVLDHCYNPGIVLNNFKRMNHEKSFNYKWTSIL